MLAIGQDFIRIKEEIIGIEDTAAAILLLTEALRDFTSLDSRRAEHFGHELALSLKNVLSESQIRLGLPDEGNLRVRIVKNDDGE